MCAAVAVLVGCVLTFVSTTGATAASGPSTQPAADPWVGEYTQIGGFRPSGGDQDQARTVSLTRTGDHYRLHGTIYDNYEFVKDAPGVLWDRKHILGTISRGTLTVAPGRTGPRTPRTVLDVDFCYDTFYLFGGTATAGAPAAQADSPGEVRQFGKPEPVNVEGRMDPLPVAAVAFSPDGKLALTANRRRIWLWDVGTGREVRRIDVSADEKDDKDQKDDKADKADQQMPHALGPEDRQAASASPGPQALREPRRRLPRRPPRPDRRRRRDGTTVVPAQAVTSCPFHV
jgi:hypothetical protein